MTKTVLVVAAHPDDEILGVGGTLARHMRDGDDVHAIIMAEGATSRSVAAQGIDEIEALRAAAQGAMKTIGANPPLFAGFSDNRMDSLDFLDVVKWLENAVATLHPNIVYTHHHGDLNVEHGIVHNAVLTAFRPLPGQAAPDIYTFETPSSTEWSKVPAPFVAQHYVNVADTLETKLEALTHYAMEMRDFPHPRSVEAVKALATWRGAEAGFPAAEAFGVVRSMKA